MVTRRDDEGKKGRSRDDDTGVTRYLIALVSFKVRRRYFDGGGSRFLLPDEKKNTNLRSSLRSLEMQGFKGQIT